MFLLALLLNVSFAFAQSHKITGRVLDGETGTGLPGVTIVEKNTTNGTTTDVDGKFSLTISSPNAIVVASFIGYTKQEIPVNQLNSINITLEPETTDLSEIVVIGYGTQKKKVVTGSIASVKSEEITSTPILRVEQAMQGRTAGVQVTNLSGQPGEQPTVRVRGTGTTGSSEPLYVVDGLPLGGIDYLNPGDIESMEVLKDAASCAIYGARGANGVVLITTKSGKAGKMNFTYSGYRGVQNVAKKLDMLNAQEYKMMMNEGATNAGLTAPFDLNEITKYDTDWQNEVFVKNAPIQEHELSVSGGNERSTYLSSLSYFSQQGIIGGEKSQFDRITARINSAHKVTKALQVTNNLSYSHIIRRGIASNQSFNGVYSSALNMDPLTPVYQQDPEILAQYPYSSEPVVRDEAGNVYGISRYVGAEVVNPLALLATQTGETRVDKFVGNVTGNLEIIKGLRLTSNFGMDMAYVLNDGYTPLFYLNGAQSNTETTRVNKSIDRYFTWLWENSLSYTKQIGDHNFSLLLGTSASKYNYENLGGSNSGVTILDPDNVYLNMATDTVWRVYGGGNQVGWASTFGRFTYNYKEKYALTSNFRHDGSSRFGSNNKYGNFPSLGLSWVVSDESFFPEIKVINTLKLRASWGINGNDRIGGDYQFISLMDKSRGYIIGGGRMIGASPQYIENADIRWEESEQFNYAIDLEMLNHRLVATVDYYIKNTNGLLERVRIPAHVGNDPPYANVGSVQNKGVEMEINWRHVIGTFKYNVGLNASYNKNEMTHIENEEKVLNGATWAVSGVVTRAQEGLPIGYFWGYKTDGIFHDMNDVYRHISADGEYLQPKAKPGDVRFVDVNGDGVIDPKDRTMIGNPTPDWTFGFNSNMSYKNFDLSFLLIGTYGNDIFNGSQREDLRYTNRTTDILDRWTPENHSNELPRYTWNDVNNNYRISDLYIEDGSYIRLKNIQLGYNFPVSILKKVGASAFKLYVSAENVLTFTKYTGADPEIGAYSSFDIAIDRGIYPQARTFRVGTVLTF